MSIKPFAYQQEGIDFLAGSGTLLAYDMGLGKSLTALWATQKVRGGHPVLIGCPSVVRGVWEAELERVEPAAKVVVFEKATQSLDGADFIIVSLDLVARNPRIRDALNRREYDALIIDEAHLLGNRTSKRSQRWLTDDDAIARRARKVWMLSGTPTPSHAGQLWPLLKAVDATQMTATEFENRYCTHKMMKVPGRGNREVRVISGTNRVHLPELRRSLSGFWLRARKEDVLKDLPSKLHRTVPVSGYDLSAEALEAESTPEALAIRRAIEVGRFDPQSGDAEFHLSRYRAALARTKGEMAADYVQGIVEQGEKCLLWFWHRDGMNMAEERLRAAGLRTCRIDGSTPAGDRRGIVARFQAGQYDVFLGQIKAAGVGITLTHASRAVFAEASWTPADNAQAEDRIHRVGQTRGVVIEYLAVKDSLDMAVLRAVERKTEDFEALEGRMQK